MHQLGKLIGKSPLREEGMSRQEGATGSSRRICNEPFPSLKSPICLKPYSGERRINLKSLLMTFWGKMGSPIGAQRCVIILPRIKCHVLMTWEDHSSRGFVPPRLVFFSGDRNLLPNLIRHQDLLICPSCSARAVVHFAQTLCGCKTHVPFAMCTWGFLRVSLERQCTCSLFWDRPC